MHDSGMSRETQEAPCVDLGSGVIGAGGEGEQRVLFGTPGGVATALAGSTTSRAVNTSFVGRRDATGRNRNARKVRKGYGLSKGWSVHRAITYFTMYSYNFCRPVRTLRVQGEDGTWQRRTPAMAAGLADHVGTLSEWLTLPTVHQK